MTHVPDLDDTPAGRLRKLDQAVARLRYADHRDPEAFHGQERDPRRAAQVGRRVGPAAAVRCDRARPRRLVGDDVRITTANTRLQALPPSSGGAIAPSPAAAAWDRPFSMGGPRSSLWEEHAMRKAGGLRDG